MNYNVSVSVFLDGPHRFGLLKQPQPKEIVPLAGPRFIPNASYLRRRCNQKKILSLHPSMVILKPVIKLFCIGTVTEGNLDAAKASAAGKVLVNHFPALHLIECDSLQICR
jgi:hypothetical protein